MYKSIVVAIERIDQERDRIAERKIKQKARAKGSHLNKEGSTGESEFSNFPGFNKSLGELDQNF